MTAVYLAAVVLGAGACGGTNDAAGKSKTGTGDASAVRALRDAREAANAKQTVTTKGTIAQGSDGSVSVTADSSFRYGPAPVVHTTTTFSGLAEPGNAAEAPKIELIATETRLYSKVLEGGGMIPADALSKQWTPRPAPSAVPGTSDRPRPPSPTADAHPALQDPVVALAVLAAAPDVHKAGDEPLDGVQTAHYQGAYPASALKTATAKSLGLTEGQYQRLAVDFLDNRQTSVRFDIWLGADRLPVQMSAKSVYNRTEDPVFTTEAPDPAYEDAVPEPLAFTVQIRLTGWGSPVDAAEPPADQVRTR
ncbi:hypothetical protein [Yinghuangia seranimata]|uniref:hypothetical protein n=1 Tax=Yinghuangia seranimata TaxID=408067 RepID=UPI00248BEF1B|nr:hypothetical protein [Yinghuangia seranimata]MDI2130322.1 hypothetical protein [Yinghuangia seranimata]